MNCMSISNLISRIAFQIIHTFKARAEAPQPPNYVQQIFFRANLHVFQLSFDDYHRCSLGPRTTTVFAIDGKKTD